MKLATALTALLLSASATAAEPGTSPWGPQDEIGRLNLVTPASSAAILARIGGGRAYDLSVDYFVGMPSWQADLNGERVGNVRLLRQIPKNNYR